MILYHPELDTTWEGPDDEALFAVMAEAGWGKTIPPEKAPPGLADVQPGATYQLVNPPTDAPPAKGKRGAKTEPDQGEDS